MRHGNKNNALGRKKAHRDALLSNLAISLIDHKRIETTLAKAKAAEAAAKAKGDTGSKAGGKEEEEEAKKP